MLLVEMTLYQLDRSTQNTFGDHRHLNSYKTSVNQIEFSQRQEGKNEQLVVKSNVRGQTGIMYNPTIIFKKVTFQPEDTPSNVTIQGVDGTEYHIDPHQVASSDVLVHCNCLDFYWRFAMWNAKHKSLVGNPPPPYVKVTNRPPVNPMQKPGVCKHLYRLIQQVKAQHIM